jgi:mono/diheme cytochrome c family protein
MINTTTLRRSLSALALVLASLNASADSPDAGQIRRGEYLATAGDCIACHTAPGGKAMAGGLPLLTPVGTIVATNITPSRTHGIGNYTLAQFSAALRKGVRADGANLYPAMPYTAYAQVTDADVQALYAYFMHGVQAVDAAPASRTALPFPFNIRWSMAGWNLLFLNNKPFVADPSKSAEYNRGAYLAGGLAHCATCHTPRNMMMAEMSSRALGGADIAGWHAPNITSDANSGVGGWSEQELVDYMRLGHVAGKAQAAGPMAEAVDHSLRHLSTEDLRAIAVYVKSVPAVHDGADSRPAYGWGAAADQLDSIRGIPLPKDLNQMTGPQLYDAHCATCHQARGQGSFDGALPSLFHNTTLGRANTDNLVMVMLEGVRREGAREGETAEVRMQGFARTLSDQQIATLGNYLQKTYGNPRGEVTPAQVKALRAGGGSSSLRTAAWIGIALFAIILVAAIFAMIRRKRRTVGVGS